MAVLSSKEWTSLSHTTLSLTSSTDSLTADKIRVLRIDNFCTLARLTLARFWQRSPVFRYVRASKPPGIRHNTLPPLVVKHLYNCDVRTDNAIITLMSTIESKKKTISRVSWEKSILHTRQKGWKRLAWLAYLLDSGLDRTGLKFASPLWTILALLNPGAPVLN